MLPQDVRLLSNLRYPAAIVLQPFLAMIGVYGPLLVACQGYVAWPWLFGPRPGASHFLSPEVSWGILVAVLFFLVYLPPTIAAAVLGDDRPSRHVLTGSVLHERFY